MIQVKHLQRLAEYYERRYTHTDNWTDCLKVRNIIELSLVWVRFQDTAVIYDLVVGAIYPSQVLAERDQKYLKSTVCLLAWV